jgi:hypothetical protein
MLNRHVYHYKAERHLRPGEIESIDGIVLLTTKIVCMNGYRDLKSFIADETENRCPDGMIITSLSYLGKEFDS